MATGDARAQTEFECTEQAYVIQGTGGISGTEQSWLNEVDQSVDPFVFNQISNPDTIFGVTAGNYQGRINNLGFRYTDGLLYGSRIASTTPPVAARLVSINALGNLTLTAVAGMPTSSDASAGSNSSNLNAGDISADGKYLYLTDSGGGAPLGNPNLYVIDLEVSPPILVATFFIRDASGNRPAGKVNDFAYNRIDGLLCGGDQNSGELAILDPKTGIRTDVSPGLLPFDDTDATIRYGGAWFGFDGTLYLYENNVLGGIYPVTFPGGVPFLGDFIDGPDSTDVDAAACAGGPAVEPDTPAIKIEKTVYEGHDSGLSGPGGDIFEGLINDQITYVFTVTNTGNVPLDITSLTDSVLGISLTNLTLLSGTQPLDPGASLVYYYETAIDNTAEPWLNAQGSLLNTACVVGSAPDQSTVDDCDDAAVLVQELCEPEDPSDGEGCTPGYWKATQHYDSWPSPYTPESNFLAIFGFGPNITFEAALKIRDPNGEGALIRHAVAALLNAASADVDYAHTVAQVISYVQNAYESGDFDGFKYLLERQNESLCLLN